MTQAQYRLLKQKLLALYNRGFSWNKFSRLEKKAYVNRFIEKLGFKLTKKEINRIYECIMLGIPYDNIEEPKRDDGDGNDR